MGAENMHHFVTVVSKMKIAGLKRALGRAKERYDENMNLYIRLILRRPCAKLIVRLNQLAHELAAHLL